LSDARLNGLSGDIDDIDLIIMMYHLNDISDSNIGMMKTKTTCHHTIASSRGEYPQAQLGKNFSVEPYCNRKSRL
jgi:hypothetical protein